MENYTGCALLLDENRVSRQADASCRALSHLTRRSKDLISLRIPTAVGNADERTDIDQLLRPSGSGTHKATDTASVFRRAVANRTLHAR